MTRRTPLWLQSGSYAGSDDRSLPGALWPAAASAGVLVTATTGMVLNIDPGYVAVPTQNNTGTTLCRSDAVETVTLDPAPASGSNRIDLVVCHPRGTDLDGGVNNDFVFEKVTGTAAASPVPPPLPAGTVALANVYVGGGVAAIVAGNITDTRPFGLALAGGAARAPYTGAGVGSYTAPDGEVWVAKAGVYAGAWRKARDVLHAHNYRTTAFNFTATTTHLGYDSPEDDPYGLYASGWTIPVAGKWQFYGGVGCTFAANQWAQIMLYKNSAVIKYMQMTLPAAAAVLRMSWTSGAIKLAAGDVVQTFIGASASMNGRVGQAETFASASYLGTG